MLDTDETQNVDNTAAFVNESLPNEENKSSMKKKLMTWLTAAAIGCTVLAGSVMSVAAEEEAAEEESEIPYDVQTIEIGNGTEVGYYESGMNNDQTVIFIHGFTMSKDVWVPMMQRFENDYHVIAIDMVGHGDTKMSESEYLNEYAFADELRGVMEAFGEDRYIAVGHSLGGCFIEQYICKYGTENLAAVAMMDSTPSFNVLDDWTYTANGEFGGRKWVEENEELWRSFTTDEDGMETALTACQTDNREAFSKIDIPAYYFYPEHDEATMADQAGMIAWIEEVSDPEYLTVIAIDSDVHGFPFQSPSDEETMGYLAELFEKAAV